MKGDGIGKLQAERTSPESRMRKSEKNPIRAKKRIRTIMYLLYEKNVGSVEELMLCLFLPLPQPSFPKGMGRFGSVIDK